MRNQLRALPARRRLWNDTSPIPATCAEERSPANTGLQLLQNSITTVFGLGVPILLFGPVTGAHFNPVVSAVDWVLGRRRGTGLSHGAAAAYTVAQIVGGSRERCWPT